MIEILPQVVATLLAIGAAFVSAYLIYFRSARDGINEKILDIRLEIANLLKFAPIYELREKIFLNDFHLMKRYREKYPNKSNLFIYKTIALDLYKATMPFPEGRKIMDEMLETFNKDNPKGIGIGGVWLKLVENSLDYLVPEGVWWKNYWHIEAASNLPHSSQKVETFPFGPIAVEKWSDDFNTIRFYTGYLYKKRDYFLKDMRTFIGKIDDDNLKKGYKDLDFVRWIEEVEDILQKIDAKNLRVQNLLRRKKSYSRKVHLPDLSWIISTGVLALVIGIFVPLAMLCLKTENFSTLLNAVIGVLAFGFLVWSVGLIIKDLLLLHKDELVVRYLIPLEKQLSDYKRQKPQKVVFDYEMVNQLVSEEKGLKIPEKLKNALKEYQSAVIESNICSEKIADLVSEEIQKSELLKRYWASPTSGGLCMSILSPFYPEERNTLLEILKGDDNLILEINYEGASKDVVKIKPPSNESQIKKISSELDRIYDDFLKRDDVSSCIEKRKKLERCRDKLLVQLQKLTGKYKDGT